MIRLIVGSLILGAMFFGGVVGWFWMIWHEVAVPYNERQRKRGA